MVDVMNNPKLEEASDELDSISHDLLKLCADTIKCIDDNGSPESKNFVRSSEKQLAVLAYRWDKAKTMKHAAMGRRKYTRREKNNEEEI